MLKAPLNRSFRPSNATEGDLFMAQWCEHCALFFDEDVDAKEDPEYPAEWIIAEDGSPRCTAFSAGEGAEPRCHRTLDMFDQLEGTHS